jgi:hypothetical protein
MADFLDEVAQYLDDSGVGEYSSDSGRNIFVNAQPPTPANCISIFGAPGANIGDQRNVASLQFPRFQALIRNVDDAAAATLMQSVRTALHAKYGVALPNWRILRCHADQEGGPIGKDGQGRFEYSINFSAEINGETPA